MKKRIKKVLTSVLLLCSSVVVFAAPHNSLEKIDAVPVGNTTIDSNKTLENKKFESTVENENSILIEGGKVTLKNPTVNKSGDINNDVGKTYGLNSAILVTDESSLNVINGVIKTDGGFGNGLFSFENSNIIARGTKIKTLKPNSSGVMVSGEGSISGTSLNIETLGSESAAIKTYGEGGNITIDKGTYKTHGIESPIVYSTSKVTVKKAKMNAGKSEGITIDGSGSVKLTNVVYESSNIESTTSKKTRKSIFIYKSDEVNTTEPSSFISKESDIKVNVGDVFYVTNTTTTIELENNNITSNSKNFLRVESSDWGTKGLNGGKVTLKATNQNMKGDIVVDKISTLSLNINKKSVYRGTINGKNEAQALSLHLDSNSTVVLEGDSYVSSMTNEKTDNSNIYLNGHKLFVNGKEVTGNTGKYDKVVKEKKKTNDDGYYSNMIKTIIPILKGAGILVAVILVIMFFVFLNNRRNNKMY